MKNLSSAVVSVVTAVALAVSACPVAALAEAGQPADATQASDAAQPADATQASDAAQAADASGTEEPGISLAAEKTYGHSQTATSNGVTFKVEWDDVAEKGEATTFHVTQSGGGANAKARMDVPQYWDNGTQESVCDPSRSEWGSYATIGDGYDFTFEFTASGTYRIYFYFMDTDNSVWYLRCAAEVTVDDAARPSVSQIVSAAVAQARAATDGSEYEMALWLHDWTLDQLEYDYTLNFCSAESGLTRAKGTCESYQRIYAKLLDAAGIANGRITGNGHTWNSVKIDGKWCQMDLTWDDTDDNWYGDFDQRHMYFGLTDELMAVAHSDHTANYQAEGYAYRSSDLSNNYFVRNGKAAEWADAYAARVQAQLDAKAESFSLTADNASFPPTACGIQNGIIAEVLGAREWTAADGSKAAVTVKSNVVVESQTKWTATFDFTATYEAEKTGLAGATVAVADQVYTGAALTPAVTVKVGEKTLAQGTDFDVAYADNVGAGTATVTVTGKGAYEGTATGSFKIAAADASGAEVTVTDQAWTGSALTPAVTVKVGEKALVAGTDYDVAYADNVAVGTATVTVTFKGNYSGKAEGSFRIAAATLGAATVTAADQTYTGSALTPAVTVEIGEKTLVAGTDYDVAYSNNVNAGTATVTVTGKGGYAGTAKGTFKINAADASKASVKLAAQTYSGSALTPAPTVTLNGKTLAKGTDYTVSYANNANAGTATATVTFKGNYSGTARGTFTIKSADASKAAVKAADQTYTGSALTPTPTVTLNGKTLKQGTDYTVSYSNNTNAGAATATVAFKGNYSGSAKATFQINAADASKAEVAVADQAWTGSALTPAVTVKVGEKTLVGGTDYDVAYSNNVAVGTATVTATFKGNYSGKAEGSFRIAAATLDAATVTAADQAYTGSALAPAVTVKVGDKTLAAGTDYDVAYSNNVNAGTATVTVTGKGGYAGTAKGTFKIKTSDASKASLTLVAQTYSGSALTPAPTVALNGKTLAKGTDYTVSYANNTNAGTATATVTFKGNYSGTAKGTFTIKALDASKASVTVASQTYSGSALTPVPTVTLNGKTLTKGTDYTVSYSGNANAGTATATVTFKGNYSGTAKGTFNIAAADASKAEVTVTDQAWTGSALTPAVTVELGGKTLTAGTDYDVAYSNNVAVGTATVAVTFKGNYSGRAEGTFRIAAATLDAATVTAADQTYAGSALTPAVTVKVGDKTLAKGTDYDVSYSNNTNAGTATVTVTFKGNYSGSAKGTFTIKAADASKAAVKLADQTYTGSAQTPTPTVTFNGKTLKQGSDYIVSYANNTNAGTATATVAFKGNYSGTAKGTFQIKAADASKAAVRLAAQTYTGAALTPAPTVVLNGKTLTKGTDYAVSHSNNVNAGTATATVTFKGNYSGTAKGTFTIKAADASKASVAVAAQIYTGGALTPAPTVTLNGKTLAKGTDYTVAYSNNTNAGTATATVTFKGNYSGTAKGTFKISAASVSSASVSVARQTYTGSALTPAVTVKVGEKALVKGTDYDVAYSNNVNAGTATVTVTGKGNYTGTKASTFTVAAADASKAAVKAADQTYTGSALAPAPTVTFNGKTLVKDADYTVAYTNNTNAGTATATVTFKGNYSGTAKGTFNISAADASKAAVKLGDQIYTGSALTPAPTVVLNGKTLKQGTDYTVAYSNNTNAGTATATVTFKGNYSGSAKGTFRIAAASVSSASVSVSRQTYTGSALTPAVTVRVGEKTLVKGADYDVAYSNNVNAGTATVTVTGKGNYTGTKASTFTVAAADASKAIVRAADQTYGGSALTPAPTVTLNGKTLKQGTDYTVSYSNNTNAGAATATVTFKGNYSGIAKGTFAIKALDASKASVAVAAQTYTGSALTPAPTVVLDGKTLAKGTDYTVAYTNNTNAGTAIATVTFKGNYSGTAKGTFAIKAADASKATVKLADQSFSAKNLTPAPTVTLNGKTLKQGTDFSVAYANNKNPGTATATVTFKGNYSGTAKGSFKIASASVSYQAHVQNIGWQAAVKDGATAGTSGQSLRVEALKVSVAGAGCDGTIQIRAHVQDIGWQNWSTTGGTTGQSKRVEAMQLRLTGELANRYDVYYRVHAQNYGWMGWAKNGASAGTEGYSLRLEAIQVKLVPKGGAAPGSTAGAFCKPAATVEYQAHVQNIGWQATVSGGATAGTSGQSLRVEALRVSLAHADYSGGVQIRAHVQDIGWQGWSTTGGTTGQSKRVEAMQICLTGEMANHYDVYYRVHAQNIGWMGWAKNGEQAGTAGYSYRLEAIQVKLVPKGSAPPGSTANRFKSR